jgi:uncharacterized protein YbgA (DUF1722 family)
MAVFAKTLGASLPMLPHAPASEFCDAALRENFIERIFASLRLRDFLGSGPRVSDLVRFHTRHKLQLLAHSPARCAELGRLVAGARALAPEEAALDYAAGFMGALATAVPRGRHVNVLQHMAGYFRSVLSGAARTDLAAVIADYERGRLALVAPLHVIEGYARRHGIGYLVEQTYLRPYPRELMPCVICPSTAGGATRRGPVGDPDESQRHPGACAATGTAPRRSAFRRPRLRSECRDRR